MTTLPTDGTSDAYITAELRKVLPKEHWHRMGVQAGEVLLLAADNVQVTLGCVLVKSDVVHLARYLAAHPTPEAW